MAIFKCGINCPLLCDFVMLIYPLQIQTYFLCITLCSYSLFQFRNLLEMEVPESRYLATCKAIEESSEAMKACESATFVIFLTLVDTSQKLIMLVD